jgi:Arc/MetJ-type ribon-helix-helix transcriptional regulator
MMYCHTVVNKEASMAVAKIAITIEQDILSEVDRLVRQHVFPSRSRAIQDAVGEKVRRLAVNRLANECAKLVPKEEKALAEEGMSGEVATWPEY